MTSLRENHRGRSRAPHVLARPLVAPALVLALGAWAAACASLETIAFSDGDCVAGGCGAASGTSSSSSSSSSSGVCVVDDTCAVKWGTDIFAGMIDVQATGCTLTGLCHGSGKGGITIEPGKPHEAYLAFMAYSLVDMPGPVKKYVVACDPGGSGILCNSKTDTGVTNPFGTCGSLMPKLGQNLTTDQIDKIADWIACGAPEN